MAAQHAAQLPPQQNHRNGQGNQHAQPQVGKGIIIAVNLVLCAQHPAGQHAVHPHRVPQGIQVHAQIAVHNEGGCCLEALPQTDSAQPSHGWDAWRQADLLELAVVYIQHAARWMHRLLAVKRGGEDADRQHIQCKQPACYRRAVK